MRGPARGPLAPLTRRPPLWAGNRELLDHALSRSDPDALLLPLLRTLAGMLSPACRLRTSRVCARASPHASRCPTTARPRDSTKPIRLPDQVYMLLIILLMLSQDGGFVSTAHAVMLPTVPWFKDCAVAPLPPASVREGAAAPPLSAAVQDLDQPLCQDPRFGPLFTFIVHRKTETCNTHTQLRNNAWKVPRWA